MKQFIIFLVIFFLASCEKEELFVYNYSELNKLLISVTRTDADSEFRAEFKYDSLNRLIEMRNIFPESPTSIESYVYDNKGKIVEKRNGSYTTTYTYNPEGQLTEQNIHYTSLQNDYDWNEKTVFTYKNGKIKKGIQYSEEGEITQYINYKYDSRGNTLEKTVRPADFESDLNLEEIKFKYDSKVNPFADSGVNTINGFVFTQHADIKQVNNPVYSSYTNLLMSSLPPEFEISYEYDSDGFPIKAVLNNVRFPGQESIQVVYEYQDIEQ